MGEKHMKLVIDGNAVYEVDQECMDKGLNRERMSTGRRPPGDGSAAPRNGNRQQDMEPGFYDSGRN